jgi:hypothetical protein
MITLQRTGINAVETTDFTLLNRIAHSWNDGDEGSFDLEIKRKTANLARQALSGVSPSLENDTFNLREIERIHHGLWLVVQFGQNDDSHEAMTFLNIQADPTLREEMIDDTARRIQIRRELGTIPKSKWTGSDNLPLLPANILELCASMSEENEQLRFRAESDAMPGTLPPYGSPGYMVPLVDSPSLIY